MATGRLGTTPVLRTRWSKEPAGGTTSLSGLDDYSVSLVYEVGYEAVYQNGALLSRGNDYTATNGTTITLTNATVAGDIIEVFANNVVPLTDTYSQSVADGKFVNNTIVDAKGDLIVGSAADTFTRLAVGSANQVLTVDSATTSGLKWATPAAGGYTLLSTTTLSSSSVSITNIDQTYTDLYLFIYDVGLQTTNGTITLNFNSITTNIFGYALNDQGGAAGSTNANIPLSLSQNINTGINQNTWSVYISQYASGSRAPYTFSGNYYSGAWRGIWGGGGRESASAITSVQITTSAGTFSSGTIKIYGVK